MTVSEAVSDALEGRLEDWRTTLARTLAAALDAEPNASMARELRALMTAIEEGAEPEVSSVADDLRARRARRIADASGL